MRHITIPLLSVLLLLILPGRSLAVQIPPAPNKPDQDVRQLNRDARPGPAPRRLAAAGALERAAPGVRLRWDHLSGSPKWIAAPAGLALSQARDATPVEIARGFLADHPDLFGLDATGVAELELTSSVPGPGDTIHLYFTQSSGGLEVFDGRVNITIDRRGRVLWLGSRLFGDLGSSMKPAVPAREALALAASDVYPDRLTSGEVLHPAAPSDVAREVVFAEREFGRPPSARLVVLGMREGSRLAWEVRIAEPGFATDYLILIDAVDGRQLLRRNLTQYASGHVLLADHPDPETEEYAPLQFVDTEFPSATLESPQGWIAGDSTHLQGNNAVSRPGSLDQPPLSSPSGAYDYPLNTAESSLVNAWFWINEAHDRFYAAGFDEAAGNFQLDNFGRGGSDNDPVDLVATPNGRPYYSPPAAHFVTTPDGEPPSLSFGWKNSCRYCADHDGFPENGGDRSIGFMRDLLFHEYGHGVTNRTSSVPRSSTIRAPVSTSPKVRAGFATRARTWTTAICAS